MLDSSNIFLFMFYQVINLQENLLFSVLKCWNCYYFFIWTINTKSFINFFKYSSLLQCFATFMIFLHITSTLINENYSTCFTSAKHCWHFRILESVGKICGFHASTSPKCWQRLNINNGRWISNKYREKLVLLFVHFCAKLIRTPLQVSKIFL